MEYLKNIQCPEYVEQIMNIIENNGYSAYIVGGCVRDSFIGKAPKDWDITTNAKPDEILKMFKKENYNIIETGLKHGTVTVGYDGDYCEVTTYRVDGDYSNHRQPDSVEFTDDIVLDLSRRDLTINAIAYSKKRGVVDPFNGIQDIEKKVIRCVGDSNARFNEDALRILRAMRFSFVLGFDIEKDTLQSIYDNAYLLSEISCERRREEFCKMLLSGEKNVLCELRRRHVLYYIVPELEVCYRFPQNNPYHIWDVFKHTDEVVNGVPEDLVLKLAAVYHDVGKPMCHSVDKDFVSHFFAHPIASYEIAEKSLQNLRFDNKTIHDVLILVRYHDYNFMECKDEKTLRVRTKKVMRMFDNDIDLTRKLMFLRIADCNGQNPYMVKENINTVFKYLDMLDTIEEEKDIPSLKTLAVNGYDLLSLGIVGKDIGILLNDMLDYIICHPTKNDKETLLLKFNDDIVKAKNNKKK